MTAAAGAAAVMMKSGAAAPVNLIPADLSAAGWTKLQTTIGNGGTATQYIAETAVTNTHDVEHIWAKGAGTPTLTMTVEIDTRRVSPNDRDLVVVFYAGDFTSQANLFLDTDSATSSILFTAGGFTVSAPISTDLGDGYIRHVINFTAPSTTNMYIVFTLQNASLAQNYAGNTLDGVFIRNISLVD
jgi:hypothetical protein